MSAIVPRCRSCGFEQAGELTDCPVCLGPSDWWCPECRAWRPEKHCPACANLLAVPAEVRAGSYPPGSRVPVRVGMRNRAKKTVALVVESLHPALVLTPRVLHLEAGESAEVAGLIGLGHLLPGPHSYRIRFGTLSPVETEVIVDVVEPIARLEFVPPEIVFPNALPGATARRPAAVKNTGNLPVVATLTSAAPWLSVLPERLILEPGAATTLTVTARPRKTACGLLTAAVRAEAAEGRVWELPVRLQLPTPELAADAVAFGEVRPERAYHHSLVLRNTGTVPVACTLAAADGWLAVTPKRINLRPGAEEELRVRAFIPSEDWGHRTTAVVVSQEGFELLRVPVSAVCHEARPVLAPLRRRSFGPIASDAPAVKRFAIANTGEDPLTCAITAVEPWLEVVTTTLKIKPGKKRHVEFRVHAPRLAIGPHQGTVRVHSNGGDADVSVSFRVVAPNPVLDAPDTLDLGAAVPGEPVLGELVVRNTGIGLLELRAEAEGSRVRVTPAALTLSPGPPARLTVAVEVGGLDDGPHALGLVLTGNGGTAHTEVCFRLPAEQIEGPAELDLGDRPAGRRGRVALRVRNTGSDAVVLSVRGTQAWLRPAEKRVRVEPGAVSAIPLRLDLPRDVTGPLSTTIRLAGRNWRHVVSVRLVARRMELVVSPSVIDVGTLAPGRQRAVDFEVVNAGDVPVEIEETHANGDLAVRFGGESIEPGESATITGRVRLNVREVGRFVRVDVPLAGLATVTFTATVGERVWPQLVPGVAGGVTAAAISAYDPNFAQAAAPAGIFAVLVLFFLARRRARRSRLT
jgi:hypothetical protein